MVSNVVGANHSWTRFGIWDLGRGGGWAGMHTHSQTDTIRQPKFLVSSDDDDDRYQLSS